MRKTRQRQVILDVLKTTSSHPSADWIYEEVRKTIPKISLGTVYRNLKLLKEKGEILRLQYGYSRSRFDGTSENHYHFTCRKCDRVYDMKEPLKRDIERDMAEKLGFVITHHSMEFYGICKECQSEVY